MNLLEFNNLSAKAVFENRLRFDDSYRYELDGPVFWGHDVYNM